jgi:hypothetical protein
MIEPTEVERLQRMEERKKNKEHFRGFIGNVRGLALKKKHRNDMLP